VEKVKTKIKAWLKDHADRGCSPLIASVFYKKTPAWT